MDSNSALEYFRAKAFLYTEVFEDNRSHASWSAGGGTFFDGTPDPKIYDISFSVYKDRIRNVLDITVHSDKLLAWMRETFELDGEVPQSLPTFGYAHFLPKYEALKSNLVRTESKIFPNALSEETVEQGLLVRDFFTDGAVLESFGFETLYEKGILSAAQWQDIKSRSIQDDLNDLDESFNLSSGTENETSNEAFHNEHFLDSKTQLKLQRAIRRGDIAVIEALLSKKTGLVDPDTLSLVLMSDNLALFRSFLNHGAIIDGDTPNQLNGPLYTAAERGCFRKCSDNSELRWERNPLFAAAKGGFLEAVKALFHHGLTGPEPDFFAFVEKTPLYAAVSCGHLEIVKYLHEHGVSIRENRVYSPLGLAAEHGHLAVVQYLHEHGANIEKPSLFRKTPLYNAARNGHLAIVQYLLEHGANVDEGWGWGTDSPLNSAAKNGHLAIVQCLLDHGADVDGIDRWGSDYPLLNAWKNGHFAIVQCLLDHGANFYPAPDRCLREWRRHEEIPVSPCPIIAEIQARDRKRIGSQLRIALSEIHQRLIDQSSDPSASGALVAFGGRSHSYNSVWKEGLWVIKKLVNGRLPQGLREVISCLQVADAMRLTSSSSIVSTKEKIECSREEFINDLDRWGSLISQDELPLFAEIVSAVWGKDCGSLQPAFALSDFEDTLSFFQKAIINIISQTGMSEETWGLSHSQGYRLRSMQNCYRHTLHVKASKDIKHVPQTKVLHPIGLEEEKKEVWEEKHESSLLRNTEQQVEIPPKVVMLMAGAIFGIILCLLLLIRCGPLIGCVPVFDTSDKHAAFNSLQILTRNCALLIAYLGLRASLPNTLGQDLTKGLESVMASYESYSSNGSASSSNGVSSSDVIGFIDENSTQYESDSARTFQPSPSMQATETSTPSDVFSHSASKPKQICLKCGKSFSNVGNKNKHLRFDCKYGTKGKFSCRNVGCDRAFTRESYRDTHERERCKIVRRRQSRETSGQSFD